jgi:type IV pilus assembly protein PilB
MQGEPGQTSPSHSASAPEALDAPDGASAAPGDAGGPPEVIRFVNDVLARAVQQRASDVHFEPFEHEFRVRCRVDGALRETASPPLALARPVISRLKVLANVNLAERRVPQDGRIRMTLGGQAVDFRLSTLPTQFGESVVLRVLDQTAGRLGLEEIGLPEALLAGVAGVLARPHGMFIVTGPTGSGKTTTLYSCLKRLNTTAAKLLTIEDPVEYEIEGIMQVAVNPAADLTFARALRTFLRQDPDIVMVGEIRDTETAQIGVQAALTGHLVLATLHTNDAPSAMTRLADLGVEPFLLASTVEAVLAQRLLRRLCTACRASYEPSAALRAQVGPEHAKTEAGPFHCAVGCAACQGSGYRGRVGLFEFLPLTERLRELVADGAPLMTLRQQAAAEGLVSLREAGLRAARNGETTLEEVLQYT